MKKKFLGLFLITTLALTLTSTTSGAAPSGDSSSSCRGYPPGPDCVCLGGFWACPLK